METLEDVRSLPQNLIRKTFALRDCINRLKRLQECYRPILDDDEIYDMLYHLHSKHSSLMAEIKQHPDYARLLKEYWKEN